MSDHAISASEAADTGPTAAAPTTSSTIATLALRRIRPLSVDWAAVLAAAALTVAVSLGWKVTW